MDIAINVCRLLLLQLDKQIGVTIYQPNLAASKACHMEVGATLEGVGYSKHALTCLVGCRLPPLDGYVAVCLVLTIEVYARSQCKTS